MPLSGQIDRIKSGNPIDRIDFEANVDGSSTPCRAAQAVSTKVLT